MEKLAATRAVVSEVSKTNRNSGFVKQQRRSAIGDGDEKNAKFTFRGNAEGFDYLVILATGSCM
jgi:hypothetical protein